MEMREKLIDIITDYADFLDWERIDGIADTIMAECFATDTNVGKWIPVTERLPEENGSYLVATERGGVLITHYWKDGQRFSTTRSRCAITHWQEKPIPPKGDA